MADFDPGQFAQMVLGLLNRPGNAVRGGLIDGPEGIGRGFTGERQYDGTELPGINQLPDQGPSLGPLHITPRTVGGFAGSAVLDPLSYLGGLGRIGEGAAGLGRFGAAGADAGSGLGRVAESVASRSGGLGADAAYAAETAGRTAAPAAPTDAGSLEKFLNWNKLEGADLSNPELSGARQGGVTHPHFGDSLRDDSVDYRSPTEPEEPLDVTGLPQNMQDWLAAPENEATMDHARSMQEVHQHALDNGLEIDEQQPITSGTVTDRPADGGPDNQQNPPGTRIEDQALNHKVDMISPEARGLAAQPPYDAMPAHDPESKFGMPAVNFDAKPGEAQFSQVQTRPSGPEGQSLPDNSVTKVGSQPLAQDQNRLAGLKDDINTVQRHVDAGDEWLKYHGPGDVLDNGDGRQMTYDQVKAWHQGKVSDLDKAQLDMAGGRSDSSDDISGWIPGQERRLQFAEGARRTTPADIEAAKYNIALHKTVDTTSETGLSDFATNMDTKRAMADRPPLSVPGNEQLTAKSFARNLGNMRHGEDFNQNAQRAAEGANTGQYKDSRKGFSRWSLTDNPNDPDLEADHYMVSGASGMHADMSTLTPAQARQGLLGYRGETDQLGFPKPSALDRSGNNQNDARLSFKDMVARKVGVEHEPGVHPGYLNNPQAASLDRLQREDLLGREGDIANMMHEENRVPGAPGMSFDDSVDTRLETYLREQGHLPDDFDRTGAQGNLDNLRDLMNDSNPDTGRHTPVSGRLALPDPELRTVNMKSGDDGTWRMDNTALAQVAPSRPVSGRPLSGQDLINQISAQKANEASTFHNPVSGREQNVTKPSASFADYVAQLEARKKEVEAAMRSGGQSPAAGINRFTGR